MALKIFLLRKAPISSCDGGCSHSHSSLWFSELVAPCNTSIGTRAHRCHVSLTGALVSVTRLPPDQAPLPWGGGGDVFGLFRMCSAARADTTGKLKGVAKACEKAEELQHNADQYWAASERIRAANADAMRRANVTVGDIRKLSVNYDMTEGVDPTEYSWAIHRVEYESLATGNCKVQCHVRKDKAWPAVPASWGHIRTGDTGWGGTVDGAVRADTSLECCHFENLSALRRIGLMSTFTDRADVYQSYYPQRQNWLRGFATETEGAHANKDATPRRRVQSAYLPVERGHSALFVSTFCDDPPPGDPLNSVDSLYGAVRRHYLARLTELLNVTSFGHCWKTPTASCPKGSCSKEEESRKYPFHFAFENSFGPG